MDRSGVRKVPTAVGRQFTFGCALEALEARRLFSTTLLATPAVANATVISQPTGYSPSQVLHAYGFDAAATSIGAVGGDGSGQTIAIIEAYHSPTLVSDLQTFDKEFGVAAPPSLKEINQSGGATPPAGNILWSQETALDVEWAHVVAPMANIVVVEADSADIGNLLTAVDTARHLAAVSVVSMSWGINEFPTETAYDGIFTTPKGHQNVTFVASTGDTTDSTQVQWPAVSPNVVSVGGTTLTVSKTAKGSASEISYAGATAGISQYEPKPAYQDAVNSAADRSTPDVVYDANPTPGFAVYNSDSAGWQTLGGTSSGAPQWAALLAVANQVRANAGRPSLNGATETLPALYAYYSNNTQSTIAAKSSTSTTAVIAGALLSNSGTPQTTGVITALLNNRLTTQSAASADGTAHLSATSLASLPRRPARQFIIRVPAAMPLLRFTAAFSSQLQPLQILSTGATLPTAAVSIAESRISSDVSTPLGSSATALLAMALPEMTNTTAASTPGPDTLGELMAAISAWGTESVVPVGTAAMLDAQRRTSWYIAHINIAATFGDSLAAFVDESAILMPARSVAAIPATRNHTRAWLITLGVMAMDGLILYYLAPRPRRVFNSDGGAHWFIPGA